MKALEESEITFMRHRVVLEATHAAPCTLTRENDPPNFKWLPFFEFYELEEDRAIPKKRRSRRFEWTHSQIVGLVTGRASKMRLKMLRVLFAFFYCIMGVGLGAHPWGAARIPT